MTGDIVKLKTQPDLPEYAQPGCDVQFIQTIGEGRQLVVKTTFAQGVDLDVQKRFVRDLCSIADYEKAYYEKQDAEFRLMLRKTAQGRAGEDVAARDKKREERKAAIDVEIDELRASLSGRALAQEQAFRNKGRKGDFVRSSAEKAELSSIERDISKLMTEKASLDEVSKNEHRDTDAALDRDKQDNAALEETIARCKMVLGE